MIFSLSVAALMNLYWPRLLDGSSRAIADVLLAIAVRVKQLTCAALLCLSVCVFCNPAVCVVMWGRERETSLEEEITVNNRVLSRLYRMLWLCCVAVNSCRAVSRRSSGLTRRCAGYRAARPVSVCHTHSLKWVREEDTHNIRQTHTTYDTHTDNI